MKKIILIVMLLYGSVFAKAQDLPAPTAWSMHRCVDYAISHNIAVKKAVLSNTASKVTYEQQKNNKVPSLVGGSSISLLNGYSVDPITSSFVNQKIVSNSFDVNGQLILYQGNTLNLQVEKNSYIVQQSGLYQKQAENSVTLLVAESYLKALYYLEGIQIAENAALSSSAELKYTQTRFENGAITRKDLADVQTQHSANEYTLVSNKTLYAQQVLNLKQLLELGPEVGFDIEKTKLADDLEIIQDKQDVFAKAAERLPDLKIFDVQQTILNKNLQIAKAGFLPTVSLNAGLSTGYTNTINFAYLTQLRSNFSQQIGLTVSIPISSKKQNQTNIKLANIDLQQNELDKIAASKTLYASIETAWLNAVSYQAQQSSAKTARDNAKLSYDLAVKKYEFGGLTPTELAVSRNTYLSNEQTYLQTKYMAVLYRSLLDFYQGGNL
jgi:outer membrane protein